MDQTVKNAGVAAPMVTVAIPVYNAGNYLHLALASIVKQTFTDWELLVIDDGSTDGALDHVGVFSDSRITVLRDDRNLGIAVRLNQAVDLAKGKYFARMDADDVSFPERFARQIAALQKDDELDLVSCRVITIDENNRLSGSLPYFLSHAGICSRPWLGFYFPHPTWLGRTEWFRRHRYPVPAPYLCEDQELLLRSHSSSRFGTVDEVLLAYRVQTRTNWHRLPRIRRAMARYQLRYFVRSGQWHFAVMTLLAWFAKNLRGRWKQYTQAPLFPTAKSISIELQEQWRVVLRHVTDNTGAP